jgi:hypothetical protein
VLAQTSPDGPNPLFNLCIAEETEYLDVQINAAIKPRDGELDQGGGLVWRYQDSNNYYVARFNPLEENYRVYKVVEGKRSQLGTAASDAATGKWHTMQIIHKGNHIQCYLNDKPYLDVTDDTFKEAGKIGLWTKADAQTSFDGLEVRGK